MTYVAFDPVNLDFTKEKVESSVNNTLEYVGLPHHLSGGQKKRVAIAGVVAMEPEVIILDEPLSNLDPVGADEIVDLLDEFNHFGKTIIISTHDVDLAYQWSDHVYLMAGGKMIGEGAPDEVFKDQDLLKMAGLRQPTTLEIYYEIERRGLATRSKIPKTVPELVGALKPPELMWVSVPPGTKEGDTFNLGVMYGDYTENCPYEAVNAKVLHIHADGRAVVEMMRKGIRAGCIMIYDMDSYDHQKLVDFMGENEIDVVGAMGTMSKNVAEKDGVNLEITSGVIEHSMMRIKDYVKKSGIDLSVSVVGGND